MRKCNTARLFLLIISTVFVLAACSTQETVRDPLNNTHTTPVRPAPGLHTLVYDREKELQLLRQRPLYREPPTFYR